MKKFDLSVWGNEILWEDEYGNPYGGFEPSTIGISVTGEELDTNNIYFENIGYIDFDEIVDDEYTDNRVQYGGEIEFTEEEEEESENYFDDPSEYEGENQTISYIEASICIRYGEVRLNGIPTGINIVNGIYFNDRIIELW